MTIFTVAVKHFVVGRRSRCRRHGLGLFSHARPFCVVTLNSTSSCSASIPLYCARTTCGASTKLPNLLPQVDSSSSTLETYVLACHDKGVNVLPEARPIRLVENSGEIGVLLIHGFSSNPASVKPWAEYLGHRGHDVRAPRLPGHGTSWQDLSTTQWPDWYAEVQRSLLELHNRNRIVIVGGQSMGGALALRLAQEHPDKVAGLVLINAAVQLDDVRLNALPVMKYLVPAFPGVGGDIKKEGVTESAYDKISLKALASMLSLGREVRRDLSNITQPVLLFRSREDHVVPASSSESILSGLRSHEVIDVVLENSYHVASLDNDAPELYEQSADFIRRVAARHTTETV